MKRILLALVVTLGLSSNVHADGRYHSSYNWVTPMVVGGVVGYALSQPRTVYVQQPQVIYVPQPQQHITVPYGYRYETILDANCNCYRAVLVPN